MRIKARMVGLDAVLLDGLGRLERATTLAMEEAGEGLKEELRDKTFAAGLGNRLPYTWKLRSFPGAGASLEPAAYVYSAAPKILSFFTAARVIMPFGAAFAIPVSPVIGRGGRALNPVEVEDRFNQDLEPGFLPSGNLGLFLNLVRGRSRRRPGFRQATKGRRAQGREVERVLMFVLVRSLRSRKAIDLDTIGNRWAGRVPGLIEKHLERLA